MKRVVGMLVSFLSAMSCAASEIVAWKVPLSSYAVRGMESEGIVRLKSPPEASPFFKTGDELWDLSGIPVTDKTLESEALELESLRIVTDPPLEWAVWNASSTSLVTKSDWNGIYQLHRHLRISDQPKHCRVKLEVFEVPSDGSALSPDARSVSALSCLVRSGQQTEAAVQTEGTSFQMRATAIFSDDADLVDLKLDASLQHLQLPKLDFDTGLILDAGVPVWIARDSDGSHGMDIRLAAHVELLDGTPLSEAVRIQDGNTWNDFRMRHGEVLRHRINGHSWLITAEIGMDVFAVDSPPDPSVDPFAAEPQTEPAQHMIPFKYVQVPDALKSWFDRPVWDMRDYLKGMGIDLQSQGEFAGYDPLTQTAFMFTESEKFLDMFEVLFSPVGCHMPKMVAITFDGVGQSRLVTRSGQRATIIRTSSGDAPLRSIEIEPTIGENDELVDLRLDFDDRPASRKTTRLNTAITLAIGEPIELQTVEGENNVKSALGVTAEILRCKPGHGD